MPWRLAGRELRHSASGARVSPRTQLCSPLVECIGALTRRLVRAVGVGQCDDPSSWRNVQHCTSVSGKCTGFDDRSADCLACVDGCSGGAGKPGVNNWCWYYHTAFPEVCADVYMSTAGCTDDCLATGWRDVPLQIIDPAVRSHSPTDSSTAGCSLQRVHLPPLFRRLLLTCLSA